MVLGASEAKSNAPFGADGSCIKLGRQDHRVLRFNDGSSEYCVAGTVPGDGNCALTSIIAALNPGISHIKHSRA